MKSVGKLITFKAQRLGFASVCASLLATGVYAKVEVDQFSDLQDKLCQIYNHSSQYWLWGEVQRQKKDALEGSRSIRTVPEKAAPEQPVLL